MLSKIFQLTPLGRADNQIRAFLKERLDDHRFERYDRSLNKYRNIKLAQQSVRILLYASIITSVAATYNVNLSIINRIASYVGFTFLLVIYGVVNYFTMLYREDYHVQRDILISTASEERLREQIESGDIEFPENKE